VVSLVGRLILRYFSRQRPQRKHPLKKPQTLRSGADVFVRRDWIRTNDPHHVKVVSETIQYRNEAGFDHLTDRKRIRKPQPWLLGVNSRKGDKGKLRFRQIASNDAPSGAFLFSTHQFTPHLFLNSSMGRIFEWVTQC